MFAGLAIAIAEEGTFSVRVDASGQRTNGSSFARIGFTDFSIGEELLQFTGNMTNRTEASTTNVLADSLMVVVEGIALADGVFAVSASLSTTGGVILCESTCVPRPATAYDPTWFTLSFDGVALERSGQDGPYLVGPVHALDVSNDYRRVGLSGVYTTASYSASAFAAADTDWDGLSDGTETALGTDPSVADTDGDGISDYDELNRDGDPSDYAAGIDLNPAVADTDGDGLLDGEEVLLLGSNPLLPDTDGDEMPDGWEVNNGLNPLLNDASGNEDGDQLSNYQEWIAGTSPTNGNSTFRIDDITIFTNEFSPVIYWQSVSGRYYSVHSKSNLTDVSWVTNQSRRFGQGGMLSYTNLNAEQTHYYRISVENK